MEESHSMVGGKLGGKKYMNANPMLQHTVCKLWEKSFQNPFCGARRCMSSEVGLWEGGRFQSVIL